MQQRERVCVCACACVCVCVLEREGKRVFASRALVIISIDGSVSDWLKCLADQFLSHWFEKCLVQLP